MKSVVNQKTNPIDSFFSSQWSVYLVSIISLLLILPNLSRESLWVDEIFSATASLKNDSLYELFFNFIFKDVHPPLYQILLFYWGKWIGSSDYLIRLPSYLFIFSSLLISYFLLKKNLSRRIAIIFFTISTLTPGVLYYAQEARSYALLYGATNILSISFIFLNLQLRENRDTSARLLGLFFLTGILVCCTHYFGYILVFSLGFTLIINSILYGRKKSCFQILATCLFLALPALVWLVIAYFYGDIEDKTGGRFWIKNNYAEIIVKLRDIFFGKKAIFFLIIGIVIITPFRKNYTSAIKNYSFIALPILIILITSVLINIYTPITTARNLIIIVPLVLFFISLIFDTLFDQKKTYIAIYILLLLISALYTNFTYKKQDWRAASLYVENNFNAAKCKIPTRQGLDIGTSQAFLIYPSYYLGKEYSYSANGPLLQHNCDLIYFDGHLPKDHIAIKISEKSISEPYKILDFNGVYVVIKDKNN